MLAAIALGSNLPSRFGDPDATLQEAVARLGALGKVAAVSSFHRTAPVGYVDQPDFLNAAALLETTLGPLAVLRGLLAIEHAMGRTRTDDAPPKGPRIIDLDLLLYQDDTGQSLMLHDSDLQLPHPEMHHRFFVLEPLAEIAPGMQHPTERRSIAQLLQRLSASTMAH